MKQLLQTQYSLAALMLMSPDTGRRKLSPRAQITLTLGGTDQRPRGVPADITTAAFWANEEDLRQLADGLTRAADELKEMVGPLCEDVRQMDRPKACDLVKHLIGLEGEAAEETDAESKSEIEDEIADLKGELARAGWSFTELKAQLTAPILNEEAALGLARKIVKLAACLEDPEDGFKDAEACQREIGDLAGEIEAGGWNPIELVERVKAEACGCDVAVEPFATPLGQPPKTGTVPPLVPRDGEVFNLGEGLDAVALVFRDADRLDDFDKFDVTIGATLQETASNLMMTAFVHGFTLGVEVIPEGLVVVGCYRNDEAPAAPSIYPVAPVNGESLSFGDVTLVFRNVPTNGFDVQIARDVETTGRNLVAVAKANGIFLELTTDDRGITITRLDLAADSAEVVPSRYPMKPVDGETLQFGEVVLTFRDPDSPDPTGPFDVMIGGIERTAANLEQVGRDAGLILDVEAGPDGITVKSIRDVETI